MRYPSVVRCWFAAVAAGVALSSFAPFARGTPVEFTHGFDVSHYQGKVRWDMVSRDGLRFVFIKATGGVDHVDPEFANNWHGAREAGLARGAYHFFCAQDDPITQAAHFAAVVKKLRANDLPPVLDVEITDGATTEQIVDGVLTWLQEVERQLGRRPMIYSGLAFAKQYLQDPRLAGYALWLAAYRLEMPAPPGAWAGGAWTFWQHAQDGVVTGVDSNVALSIFRGSEMDLGRFIQSYQAR